MSMLNVSVNKLLVASFLFVVLVFPSFVSAADESEISDIQEYVNDMQPGWNLGNTFDAVGSDETAWGNPRVTKTFIQQIAAQGYKSIRIPITFDQRMNNEANYEIDADYLSRIEQVIQWSLDEDMYVMINIHHDSWLWLEEGMNKNHDESLARYEAIWTQISEYFKDYSQQLMFESINEPRFVGTDEEKNKYLYELNTTFYEIVRQSGGNNDVRPLVLPTLDTGHEQEKIEKLYETIVELDDPYLISTFHYYGFWPFSVNIAGYTRFEEDTKQDIVDTFDRVYNQFTANGIPVIIGEFGLLGFDTDIHAIQQGEKLKFFEYLIHYAKEKQFTHMLWDNGQHFGRTSFQWSDNELYKMMKASWDSRSAIAESDFIYLKKDESINDAEIALTLHGNEFESLQLNGEKLIEGQDYELKDETLVVKANLLAKLTSSGELGKNAEIIATFTKGADWRLDVITYDTPVVDSVEGETNDFSIPIQFNGNQLATMEAVYADDGSPAGPQNWTAFKEFSYTFTPIYEKNEILLKDTFFNEVDDDREVNLTFHFWSGETLAYTVSKNGNQVVGDSQNEPTLDVSTLTNAINQAEAITNENNQYTEESFKSLQSAITQAKSALETVETEEDLQKEIKALEEAIEALEASEVPAPLDVSTLTNVIKRAEAITNENNQYTEESFKSLQAAITQAKSALETVETEEDLQKEIKALEEAIEALEASEVPTPLDVSALTDVIKKAEAITNENNQYTEESFKSLQSAITQAKSALETVETEEDVQKEIKALEEAIEALEASEVPAPLDVSALTNVIKRAEAITNENNQYTVESFKSLQSAITQAKSALKTVETEEDVQKAIKALEEAIEALEASEVPTPLDVSELTDVIKRAEAITNENNQYTEGSFKSLQAAITQAKSALETVETEEDVQKAIKALEEAIRSLENESENVGGKDHDIDTSETKDTNHSTNGGGGKLPNTATSIYTIFITGVGLLFLGAITLLILRKRRFES